MEPGNSEIQGHMDSSPGFQAVLSIYFRLPFFTVVCASKDMRTAVSVQRMAKILIWMATRLSCASGTTLTALPWVNLPLNKVNGYFAHVICLISVTS